MADQNTAVADIRAPSEQAVMSDFLRGQSDCKNGEPAKLLQSQDYYRGYSAQYGLEQIRTEQGIQNEYRRSQQAA